VCDGTNGGVTFDTFATTIGSNMTGNGRFNKSGTGTLTLTGTNAQAGGIRVSGGTLEIASEAQSGSGGVFDFGFKSGFNVFPATLRALGHLTIPATRSTAFVSWTVDTNGFDVTFNQSLNGANLTKEGAGVLRLNSPNTTTEVNHLAAISAGILRFGANNALGTGVQVNVTSGAVLDLNGFNQTVLFASADGGVQLGSGTLTVRNGGVFNAPISGSGALVLDGAGAQLNVANSFSGGLTVKNGGAALVAGSGSLGVAGNAIVLDNGELGTNTLATAPVVVDGSTNLTIAAGGARFSASGQSLVLAAPLSGSAPLLFIGGSGPFDDLKLEVRLAHPANTFVGDVIVGNSQIGFDTTLGIVADGSLGAASNVVRLGDRFFDGESTRTNRGMLRAFADLALPASRAIVLRTGGSKPAIDTNGFSMTIEGAITESFTGSTLLKVGDGTLFLNGANTFTGETTVLQGALGGTGTLGPVRVTGGGTIAPGHGLGTLHVGNVTFDFGATLALEFASPAAGDQLSVAGTLAFNGDVQLALDLGYTVANEDTFVVLFNAGPVPIDTNGGLFALGDDQLTEGETFTADGATWTISYVGGSGNDVTLTVIPEPSAAILLLFAGLGGLLQRNPRRSPH
jgi:autotransporter-associated beta strand protein